MSDFEDRLRSKLQRMTAAPPVGVIESYDKVLEDFVRVVNTETDFPFRLLLEKTSRPERRTISIQPRYRESPCLPLLVMALEDGKLMILAEKREYIASPAALQERLEQYLDTLGGAIQTFAELEQQPVQGYLRVRGPFDMDRDDVAVEVAPAAQKKLAMADAGAQVVLDVRPRRFPGAGTYNEKFNYVAFESNGFALEDIRHQTVSPDVLRLTGTKVRDESAAA